MKTFTTIFVGSFLFLVLFGNVFGQAIKDPASLPVYEANGSITIDGNLNETDWLKRYEYLVFKAGLLPGDVIYTVTDTLTVKPVYTDTTTTFMKFLHKGLDLYISFESNDKSVGKFGTSWEGDGLFMKIKTAGGIPVEFKLFFNQGGVNPDISYEGPSAFPNSGSGAAHKNNGTVVNDTTQIDSGYTAEMVIHLDQLGYTDPNSNVEVMINIFDPDGYLDNMDPYGPVGSYWKSWWGSEWGSEFRTLNLMAGTSQYDPASLSVYSATSPITVDGNLNEADWAVDAPQLMFRMNGTPSGMSFTPTNAGIVVKPPYADTSTCYVKFLHYGTKLYVALQSNDKQVCKFDWEGDGMFMVVKNASNQNSEFKLYVINSTTFGAETGGAAPIPSGGYGGVGIVNGTIYDSTDVDNGYTAEGFIDLSTIGYTTLPSSLQLFMNIFDPDNILPSLPFGPHGAYAKQWWGSEWGSELRTLNLLSDPVPVELTSFIAAFTLKGIDLRWETATETNNQGFEVQRSVDNKNFVKVAFVPGIGTSTEKQYYSYLDDTELTGSIYYRLKQLDFGGNYNYSNTVEVSRAISYELSQNYPNPFNPTTTITYSIPQNSFVTLKVYDILGSEVDELVNEQVDAGVHKVNFNGFNLNSGVYFYIIKAGNFSSAKKMTLMK